MFTFILTLHILIAIGLVTLILLQHGKGADAGAAFGGGASGSVFGARGASSFLSKLTSALAASFFATSLTLTYLATSEVSQGTKGLISQQSELPTQVTLPQTPVDIPK